MAAALVADGKDSDAERKAHNVVVQSEIVDVVNDDCSVPQGTGPACGDPMGTFGSLGGRLSDDVQFPEYEDGDSTECSSSFDASYSVFDDDLESDTGALEVDSIFQSHINIDDTTLVPHLVKKREVTADWRKYIGPVMWRCQWLELRMKDLLSQVAKYDKELAIIDHEKDLQLEMMKTVCPNSGLQKLDPSHQRNTMKRRKRKRDEDIMDSSSSAEKHLILSYYNEKEKKKIETDERLDDDDVNSLAVGNTESSFGLNDTLSLLEFMENDTVVEQYSLRDILSSIDGIQSRIISLQNHLSKANTMDHSPKAKKAQRKKKLHSFLQKKDTVPGSVDITQPAEDEVTFEMLFGTGNPLFDAGIRGLYKETAADVLVDNQAATEEGYWQFERVNQKADQHLELVKNVDETPSAEEENRALIEHESVSIPATIVTLVNKRGPKPKNKHNIKKKVKEDFDNSSIEETILVAVDTRSQCVRKPKKL